MIQRPPIFGGIFVLWVTGWVTFQIYLKIILRLTHQVQR